ncbi:MAG: hypothetical protein ACP5SI_11480 [Chloroflexia bacterium]
MPKYLEYASFLVRLSREAGKGPEDVEWHGEVEHIQSGQRWMFPTLEDLLQFLRSQAESLQASDIRG